MPQHRLKLSAAGDLLADPETHATVIHAILLAALEIDIYHEDVLELYARIEDKFSVRMPEENENKLNAILLAVSTNGFFEDPIMFASIASALFNGDIGDEVDGELNGLTLPEVAWAMFEVGLNRDDSPEYEPQVTAAVATIASKEAHSHPDAEQTASAYTARVIAEKKAEMVSQFGRLGVPLEDLPQQLQ